MSVSVSVSVNVSVSVCRCACIDLLCCLLSVNIQVVNWHSALINYSQTIF